MSTLETLPDDLPWQTHAYLLLDGVSVNNLQARITEWYGTPEIQVLYATTPLALCNEISPCLITLNGPHTPGLGHYLAHSGEEWGYSARRMHSTSSATCACCSMPSISRKG